MRIGFIAISGLRLCQPEILALGLSFPTVSRRAREIESLPSLGLLTLAGMTPPGIEVEYLEIAEVSQSDLPLRFDAVCLSALTASAKEAYRLARRFRDAGIPVILGGLHATLNPDEATQHADAICVGEGESVWPRILSDLQAGTLQRRYDARAHPFDLAEAPMPAFHLLDPCRYPRFTVQTQRGCPLACEFCAASMRLSAFKVKPVSKIISEIRRLKELHAKPFIEFADDNTFVNRAHAKELLLALAKEGVRWFTETDLRIAKDEELLGLMRDAGCQQVLIGFESPDYAALDGVELRSNWKARQVSRALESVERIQRHGITVNGCFILGMDGAGPESFGHVLRFGRESGLYDVQITYLTPFPGTPLYQRLSESGRILARGATERCTLFDINFQPQQMSVEELETGFLRLAAALYKPEFVTERARRYRQHLRRRVREKRLLGRQYALANHS